MNQKEIVLTALILIGLVFTATSLTKEECYDCNQPVFSISSSCADFGGACIKINTKAGFSGLMSYFTGIEMTESEDGLTFSSSPGCSIKFSKEVFQLADSVNYVLVGTHQ